MNNDKAFIKEVVGQNKKLDEALIYFRLWYEFLKLNDVVVN